MADDAKKTSRYWLIAVALGADTLAKYGIARTIPRFLSGTHANPYRDAACAELGIESLPGRTRTVVGADIRQPYVATIYIEGPLYDGEPVVITGRGGAAVFDSATAERLAVADQILTTLGVASAFIIDLDNPHGVSPT